MDDRIMLGQREIVFDIETTGLSPRYGDRIVSIALVEVFDCSIIGDRLVILINPLRKIPKKATEIHGIYDGDVLFAPIFSDVAKKILEFVGTSALVGYNVNFDRQFLEYELESIGEVLPTNLFVDVMDYVSLHSGGKVKLHAACANYGIDLGGMRAHSAEDDAVVTALLYIKLSAVLPQSQKKFAQKSGRITNIRSDQDTFENPDVEKAWRAFQTKDYDRSLLLVADVIALDVGRGAQYIDARPYELGAMICRRLKRLESERDILFTYFRRAVRPDIDIAEIAKLAEPPPMNLSEGYNFAEWHSSAVCCRPEPRIWEMATRLMRVVELGQSVECRLLKALKAIPSPFGYEEAAICLRKIISEKIASNENCAAEIEALYGFAQQHAFLYEEMFDRRLGYPVHVIVDRIPRDHLKS